MTITSCFVGASLCRPRTGVLPPSSNSPFLCGHKNFVLKSAPKRRRQLSMGLFGLGFPELAVIAGVAIVIFGPSKIAELGKDLGGLAGGVKKATSEFREAMQESLDEADREIERKQLEKESVQGTTVDASAKAVEQPPEKTEG